jgi:hypothetical protein
VLLTPPRPLAAGALLLPVVLSPALMRHQHHDCSDDMILCLLFANQSI